MRGLRLDGDIFVLELDGDTIRAGNVVVATGAYQEPTRSRLVETVPEDVFHLHTSAYRHPDQLPPGAVLVVGGRQSGCQISDELLHAGRSVVLSIGRCPWLPRRYRAREIVYWLEESGFMDQTVETPPSPTARLLCNAPISGNDGGHDCHPRWLADRGATLVGRLASVDGHRVSLSGDLEQSLVWSDQVQADILQGIDDYIVAAGIDAPAAEQSGPWPPVSPIESLDLREPGISTILWSNGYRPSFGWIELPLFDEHGWPVQHRGVTAFPGLYFVGLHWLHKRKSSLLFGVGEDAEQVVAHLTAR